MRNKQVDFNPNIYTLSKLSRFGYEAKEKYRGMFEIQKSGDKTSPGEIGLDTSVLIHNRAVFRTAIGTAGSYVTGTVSWKNGCQNFLMFITAETLEVLIL